jgi:DNA-binding NtrC family response regulator
MSYSTYKSAETPTVRSSMTPCIFDDDPAERDALNSLIMDMSYEPVCTSDAEEALRLIRLGRCRLVFDQHSPGRRRSVRIFIPCIAV